MLVNLLQLGSDRDRGIRVETIPSNVDVWIH